MSSRWYPLYQRGNPQLRVFLPNFFMKLVKSTRPNPANMVHFEISSGMSKYDVKNYLEKIYNVPVVSVRIATIQGHFKKAPGKQYIIKEDDYKKAYVLLPADYKFEFPDLFPKDKIGKEIEQEEKLKKDIEVQQAGKKERNKFRPDVPKWFA